MKDGNAWKLVKHEDYTQCEHTWTISNADDSYVYATCNNCGHGIEWCLEIMQFVSQYYDMSEPSTKKCTECDDVEEECDCYKCPMCGMIDSVGDEDETCYDCACYYCGDYHGCEVVKCSECGDETGCENMPQDDWDDAGMCYDCYEKSQMPEKEKEITEQIEGLQKQLADIQKVNK